LLQFFEVPIVQPVCDGDENLIPAGIPGLVSPDEQQGVSIRVESIENPVGTALVLNAEFPHMGVPAHKDLGAMRRTEGHSHDLQQADNGIYADLFFLAQTVPPRFEFGGVEHVNHTRIIAYEEYSVK
jgi:hypothetical protein